MDASPPFPKALVVALSLSLLIWIFPLSSTVGADGSFEDDAHHYISGIRGIFNEAWYFNGVAENASFFITYLLQDPEDLFGMREIQASIVIFEGGRPVVIASRESRGFGGEKNRPGMEIGQGRFSAVNESSFSVSGEGEEILSGAPVSWDLIYDAAAEPWLATPVQISAGCNDTWMRWLAYMPSARVQGMIVVDNRTIDINGTGYHDHNWGVWPPGILKWNRVMFFDPAGNFSMTAGEVVAEGSRRSAAIGANYQGEAIRWSSPQTTIIYEDNTSDPETGVSYPAAYRIAGENGRYKIDVTARAVRSQAVPSRGSGVVDQIVEVKGTLMTRGGVKYEFGGMGLAQYSIPGI